MSKARGTPRHWTKDDHRLQPGQVLTLLQARVGHTVSVEMHRNAKHGMLPE